MKKNGLPKKLCCLPMRAEPAPGKKDKLDQDNCVEAPDDIMAFTTCRTTLIDDSSVNRSVVGKNTDGIPGYSKILMCACL
jgi:hypothetical protein